MPTPVLLALARTKAPRRVLGVAIALFAALVFPTLAFADFKYTLDQGNDKLTGYSGPYGTVTVHLVDSTHATITLDANPKSVGGNYYLFSDGSTLALNFNGTLNTASTVITSYQQPASMGSPSLAITSINSPTQVDGRGQFNFIIDNQGQAGTTAVSEIVVNAYLSSGTWSSDGAVLTANATGYSAAGHVFVYTNPDYTGSNPTTGYAGDGGGSEGGQGDGGNPVPAPSSALAAISGLGLFGLIGLVRRRRQPAAA
jgi:hypothetical protein